MATLINRTGSAAIPGYLVKISPKKKGAFEYAGIGDVPIGVVGEAIPNGAEGEILTSGTIELFTDTYVPADGPVRGIVASDRSRKGFVAPIGGETAYTLVGRALDGGRGRIKVLVNIFTVVASSGGAGGVAAGGTTGQAYLKNSGADFDAGWYTLPTVITDHTLLSNIGTRTHAQIDAHIVNFSNPHDVIFEDLATFGTDGQIPYMNALDDDFLYSPNMRFNGTTINVNAVQTDLITSKTGGVTGVTVEGVLLRSGEITVNESIFSADANLYLATNSTGEIRLRPDGEGSATGQVTFGTTVATIEVPVVEFDGQIQVDTINERGSSNGVTIEGVLLKDNDVEVAELRTDLISEKSIAAGVTIDGVILKDSVAAVTSTLKSTTTSLFCGTTGAGNVYVRPSGYGASSNQTVFGTGDTTFTNQIIINESAGYTLILEDEIISFTRDNASYIRHNTAGGYLLFVTNGLTISSANAIMQLGTSAVLLRYGASSRATKLETTNTGIDVTGNVEATGDIIAYSS